MKFVFVFVFAAVLFSPVARAGVVTGYICGLTDGLIQSNREMLVYLAMEPIRGSDSAARETAFRSSAAYCRAKSPKPLECMNPRCRRFTARAADGAVVRGARRISRERVPSVRRSRESSGIRERDVRAGNDLIDAAQEKRALMDLDDIRDELQKRNLGRR